MMEAIEKFALAALVFLLTYLSTTLIYQVEKQEVQDKVKELETKNIVLQKKFDSVQSELFVCSEDLYKYQINLFRLKDEYPKASHRYDELLSK